MSAHAAAWAARRESSGPEGSREQPSARRSPSGRGRLRASAGRSQAGSGGRAPAAPQPMGGPAGRGGAGQRERCGRRRSPAPRRKPTRGHPSESPRQPRLSPSSARPRRQERQRSQRHSPPPAPARKPGINTERTIPPVQAGTATNQRPGWDVYFTGSFTTRCQTPKILHRYKLFIGKPSC